MLTTKQIIEKYGKPDPDGKYLVLINLPYPMRLAWTVTAKKVDTVTVSRLRCHRLVAARMEKTFKEILAYYGIERIQELGIDLFGGCFEYRKMRGGSDWSRHSWGIAIDLDPARNSLKTPWARAQFSKTEYKPMLDIFYANGFINLGKEKNYDAMHFEIEN